MMATTRGSSPKVALCETRSAGAAKALPRLFQSLSTTEQGLPSLGRAGNAGQTPTQSPNNKGAALRRRKRNAGASWPKTGNNKKTAALRQGRRYCAKVAAALAEDQNQAWRNVREGAAILLHARGNYFLSVRPQFFTGAVLLVHSLCPNKQQGTCRAGQYVLEASPSP